MKYLATIYQRVKYSAIIEAENYEEADEILDNLSIDEFYGEAEDHINDSLEELQEGEPIGAELPYFTK